MIAFVEGQVVSISADSAVLQAGGVGYRVFCGPGTLTGLHEGASSRLYTHHLVREDMQALYGFGTTEELGFFELLDNGHRGWAQGRARDRVVAPGCRPSAGHLPGR